MERDLYRGERKAEERLPLISLKLDLVDLLEDNALPVSLAYMYEERLEDIVVLPEDQQRAELLKKMANIYHGEVIPHVPVDTSRLVDSITIFGEGIPHDFVEVGTNVEYALYVNDGHVQHKRRLKADRLTVGGKTKYLKNRNQTGITLSERYVAGSFFMEKGMQDAKPRLERLIESFMEQTSREIEGGRL